MESLLCVCNGFEHTYFLFTNEFKCDIDENAQEDLVQVLQNALKFMEDEKKLKEDFLPFQSFTNDETEEGKATVTNINLLTIDDFMEIDRKLRNGEISVRSLCNHFHCGHGQIKKMYKIFGISYPNLSKYSKRNIELFDNFDNLIELIE